MPLTMYEENTSSKSSLTFVLYICGFLVLFLIGGLIFLFTKLTDTKDECSEDISKCQQEKAELTKEQKAEICTYARYGIEYTDEETEGFKTYVYRHIEETEEGYLELVLRLNKEENTFAMDLYKESGNSFVLEGTYTEESENLVLEYPIPECGGEEECINDSRPSLPSELEFVIKDSGDGEVLEYVSETIDEWLPKKGDKYYFYWTE